MSLKKYKFAISYASEENYYVEEVAKIIKKKGIDCFYAPFEEASIWGSNLADYLTDIYYNQSEHCIMFISIHYVSKAWPNHERQVAIAKHIQEKGSYILPVRFDNSIVPGLPSTIGYINALEKTPGQLVELLLQKFPL